ncbi:origin recognition complex subunit [Phlyctema vagabunda]|uniref:Origin recognition complex subunit 3 n=1 Tax=Phlyctema vagabunda TaxID=108571 RepID=A0ABR4PJL8_9HELO
MSVEGDTSSHVGFDASDHQAAYIFTPSSNTDSHAERAPKRQKVSEPHLTSSQVPVNGLSFLPLLNRLENPSCINLRQELYQKSWASTETRIQSILSEANENTLADVAEFVQDNTIVEQVPARFKELVLNANSSRNSQFIPTGFIVTGPNIASQGLLFKQLSDRLQAEVNGPTVTLQSGDASNLKAALKRLIRDATNQKPAEDDEESNLLDQNGRKLLNYDLEILHSYVKLHGSGKVVVAFQDSEAFDGGLLTELITLFMSWSDRIPFVLLFGIATSVDLFHERLPRAATRCLSGAQFDVEQTSSVVERVFRKVIAGFEAPLQIGPSLISSLMERQYDHVQSVQAFISALKYAYMCHFYANPLTIFLSASEEHDIKQIIQKEHYEAVRNLPSFKYLVEELISKNEPVHARQLLEEDAQLLEEIKRGLEARGTRMLKLLRAMHILTYCSSELTTTVDLYMTAFAGALVESDAMRSVLESVKRMGTDGILKLLRHVEEAITNGGQELDLAAWPEEDSEFLGSIKEISNKTRALAEEAERTDTPIRSKYTAKHKVVRTTVIAQKVQLSHDSSKLSKQDAEFTDVVDRLIALFQDYFTCETPQDLFMNEIWLYDSKSPYRDVFTPRPRFAIERALSVPHDYLQDAADEGLASAQPATALLYQLYLETGSLINIFDLWSAFYAIVGGEDGEGCGEREALALFYRALADLRLLGMVKQSKKKTDHLAKQTWKGL